MLGCDSLLFLSSLYPFQNSTQKSNPTPVDFRNIEKPPPETCHYFSNVEGSTYCKWQQSPEAIVMPLVIQERVRDCRAERKKKLSKSKILQKISILNRELTKVIYYSQITVTCMIQIDMCIAYYWYLLILSLVTSVFSSPKAEGWI